MSDNNDFLSHYGKSRLEDKEIVVKDAPLTAYNYEQKSDFAPPSRQDAPSSAPPGRTKLIIGIAVAAAVLLIAVLALVLLLNRGVEMADLTGWTKTDADLWANENGVQLQATEEYNDEYAQGVVFAQDVPPGERVKKGDFIRITVSKGHDLSVTLTLPDLMSMNKAEVDAWALANFMSKVRITAEYSDTVPLDDVISFTVNDDRVTGDTVRRDSPVYVVVSNGPEDEAALQVTLPDFKTMTLSECYVFASENGLTLIVQEQYDGYVAAGSVISQSVKAQEKVGRGTEITLVVSMGKKITVPDFSDYTKEGAAAKAAELGIPVTITERYSGASVGGFISQSITAGTIYEAGDILELKYSLGNKVVVASYVGQTLDMLQTWAQGLNAQGAAISVSPTYTQSSSPAGTVLSQSPANKEISYRSAITVTVSSGRVVYVPDFVADGTGYDGTYATAITREDAIAMCDAAGLIPLFVQESTSGRLPGEVWQQSLAAGTETTQGTTITLKYVPSSTATVPSFINMTEANATASATAAEYGDELRIEFVEGATYVGGGANIVIEQSITAGTTVVKGTTITLTLGLP